MYCLKFIDGLKKLKIFCLYIHNEKYKLESCVLFALKHVKYSLKGVRNFYIHPWALACWNLGALIDANLRIAAGYFAAT